jgi:hypothetical protein
MNNCENTNINTNTLNYNYNANIDDNTTNKLKMRGNTSSPVITGETETKTVKKLDAEKKKQRNKQNKNKRRCCMEGCKKMLKLTAFACKCGNRFCHAHQHAEQHNCTYDFKNIPSEQANKLISKMKCVDDKIEKI